MRIKLIAKIVLTLVVLPFALAACQHTGGGYSQVAGNENGSAPVNEKEVHEYKREILKCYKTGGTRVIKIDGRLRCFN